MLNLNCSGAECVRDVPVPNVNAMHLGTKRTPSCKTGSGKSNFIYAHTAERTRRLTLNPQTQTAKGVREPGGTLNRETGLKGTAPDDLFRRDRAGPFCHPLLDRCTHVFTASQDISFQLNWLILGSKLPGRVLAGEGAPRALY